MAVEKYVTLDGFEYILDGEGSPHLEWVRFSHQGYLVYFTCWVEQPSLDVCDVLDPATGFEVTVRERLGRVIGQEVKLQVVQQTGRSLVFTSPAFLGPDLPATLVEEPHWKVFRPLYFAKHAIPELERLAKRELDNVECTAEY